MKFVNKHKHKKVVGRQYQWLRVNWRITDTSGGIAWRQMIVMLGTMDTKMTSLKGYSDIPF